MESTPALQGVIKLANEHPNFNCTNVVLLDGSVNTSLEIESIIGSVFFGKLTPPHKEGKPTSRGER